MWNGSATREEGVGARSGRSSAFEVESWHVGCACNPYLVDEGLRVIREVRVDLRGDAAGNDLQDLGAQIYSQDVSNAREWPAVQVELESVVLRLLCIHFRIALQRQRQAGCKKVSRRH